MTLRPDMQPPDKTPSAGTPTRPKPQLQEPTVPLVVFTAFDAATAEELSRRLQNTAHPADNPPPPSHSQPPPTYQSDIADYEARQEERLGIHSAAHDRGQTIFDVQTLEPETTTQDLEVAWSSEQPWLSLNAAEMSDYFSAQEDKLVREVAISLQHEKFILHHLEDPLEYLKIFAEYGWDEESDEVAEEFIQWYVERFRPELEQQWDDILAGDAQSDLEYWIRNVANDERESVIVYDLETGETLFVRFGDRDSVTLQEWHQKLTEGRNIIVIHNHPNNSGASVADLSGAVWLDAEWLLVVNPDGTLHRHQKIDGEIVELKPLH
ncbi:MAG: hypothetical protein OXG85_08605, partial [Chloroflexi bacterium]|nr:hypothetical protein [Chloroflexota bacterium]